MHRNPNTSEDGESHTTPGGGVIVDGKLKRRQYVPQSGSTQGGEVSNSETGSKGLAISVRGYAERILQGANSILDFLHRGNNGGNIFHPEKLREGRSEITVNKRARINGHESPTLPYLGAYRGHFQFGEYYWDGTCKSGTQLMQLKTRVGDDLKDVPGFCTFLGIHY